MTEVPTDAAPGTWTSTDAADLRRAIDHAGHTQSEVGDCLQQEFGLAVGPAQGTISKWARFRDVPRPQVRRAIRRYIETYGPREGAEIAAPGSQRKTDTGDSRSSASTPQATEHGAHPRYDTDSEASPSDEQHPGDTWSHSVHELAGEPMLGPRQAAFVDGVNERLRYGPPFSETDWLAIEAQMRILGLD